MDLSWLLYVYLAISTIWLVPVLWKITKSKARDDVLWSLCGHQNIILLGVAVCYAIISFGLLVAGVIPFN